MWGDSLNVVCNCIIWSPFGTSSLSRKLRVRMNRYVAKECMFVILFIGRGSSCGSLRQNLMICTVITD